MQKQYKQVSSKAKRLLLSGETALVDYKKRINGLHATDLVAFANSVSGGTIMLGVAENKATSGQMIGEIVGHSISDEVILQIIQKANSCHPTVKVNVIKENVDTIPFIRIDIPSGESKPYCDGNGTYKIRIENQNAAIRPKELLELFLQAEESVFTSRFSNVSAIIEKKLTETFQSIDNLESAIDDKLDEMMWDISSAEQDAGKASRTIEDVEALLQYLIKEQKTQSFYENQQVQRLRQVVKNLSIDDPSELAFSKLMKQTFVKELTDVPLFKELILNHPNTTIGCDEKWNVLLGEADIKKLIDAVRISLQKEYQ